MTHIEKAYDGIKLAAHVVGGINKLAERAGVNVDTARRLLREETKPVSIRNLETLEAEAKAILGERMP